MRLSTFFQQNRVHHRNYFLLLLVCLLAYWPLTFGIFSVKNDAIHYFLPYRFNISEALRNGELPSWSPYIYLGNPVHGDMQSGAWNPVVWFFSAMGRYDITLFHYENLLYIFLGGIGMYKLTNRLVEHSHTALLIAVSYMLSGFMLGGQLINWLAAAAFLPFVIHYYLLFLRRSANSDAIKTGIALFFLFTAGYPSFFILIVYLLLTLFIIDLITHFRKKNTKLSSPVKFLLQHLLITAVFTALSLPAIVSFIDLLPYYQRGGGASYSESVSNAFDPQHFLTLLFPSTIKANDTVSSTDITCRNIYFGLIPLVILFIFPPKASRRNILLMILAVLALLFSVGGATPFQRFCYKFIPLLDTFRHPSQMRLFFILAILLLAAPGIKKLLTEPLPTATTRKIKILVWTVAGLLLVLSVIAFSQSTLQNKLSGFKTSGTRTALKNILDSVSFNDTLAVNAALQLFFIIAFAAWFKKRSAVFFSVIWIANIFIMAELVLPVSFVSKVSPKEINGFIHSSPRGFPPDSLQNSLAQNSKDAFDNFDVTGLRYFYNKKIGISRVTNSPAFLAEQDSFIRTHLLYQYVAALPVVYIADSVVQLKDTALLTLPHDCKFAFSNNVAVSGPCTISNKAFIKTISSNRFEIETETTGPALLVLSQNYYHHWRVTIDGASGKIIKTNMSFMGTQLPAGKHSVIFRFVPANTIRALWVQLTVLLVLLITVMISLYKNNKR